MASSHHTHSAQAGLALDISASIHHALQAIADYRAYRATVRALKRLDTNALADLGIVRTGIKAAAHKAVYGV